MHKYGIKMNFVKINVEKPKVYMYIYAKFIYKISLKHFTLWKCCTKIYVVLNQTKEGKDYD